MLILPRPSFSLSSTLRRPPLLVSASKPNPPKHLHLSFHNPIFHSITSVSATKPYRNVDDDVVDDEEEYEEEEDFTSKRYAGRRRGGGEEKDHDRDPEFAEILGECFDDPTKAQSHIEERIRKKRNKILHAKTGSATPMKVVFNKFDFSNSYIWFDFYNAPLEKDVTLICDTIRSWHIIGRLGGCNSMNMQVESSGKGLSEYHDFRRTKLKEFSYIGIRQVVFGGPEFGNWKENLTAEEAGCSVHKI
ncbi:hypothetical protein QJS04_geneDACA018122 [Acorus gramineus]|uniref:Uncharacterized protein n=1 Tax=Acorus gramineus TaxID=55184 RepID=A0AAV9AK32_ACOGR|nr:hypothetical protein QJS04_geneDACA018122 [Acorus gramineus]